MKQRKDHEAWVEQLAAVCDATNVEKQRLAAEIIFLEHNMDRKKLLRVILRLGKDQIVYGLPDLGAQHREEGSPGQTGGNCSQKGRN